MFAVGDLGIVLGDGSGTAQKQAIRELHDVGFVNGVDLFAVILAGVLESKTRNACRSFLGNDFQALDHTGDNFVFEAGVKALGIFANDDKVHVGIACRDVRQIANGTEVGVELKLLP